MPGYVTPWRRDPFAALERFNRLLSESMSRGQGGYHPDVDVEEGADGWTVEVRLPGVAPDEVQIEVADRELHISSVPPEDPAPGKRLREFSFRLGVPADVDTAKIDATMDHGLLTVTLPRLTESRTRRISVGRRSAETEAGQPVITTGGESASA